MKTKPAPDKKHAVIAASKHAILKNRAKTEGRSIEFVVDECLEIGMKLKRLFPEGPKQAPEAM
jgi:hypothetical protein